MNQSQNQVGNRKSEVGETGRRSRHAPISDFPLRTSRSSSPLPLFPSSPLPSSRRAFTLIELLIAILIIGILSAVSLAALMRARQAANVANTKTTVAKLHSQIQMKWDSYRSRKVPIDAQALLMTLNNPSPPPQAVNALGFINQLWVQRGSKPPPPMPPTPPAPGVSYDTMGITPGDPRFPVSLQISAVRLFAMRELQRYEMPSTFQDFAVVTNNGPPYAIRTPKVLGSAPSMAYTYLRKLNAAMPTDPVNPGAQISNLDPAECLYMLVNSGLEDVSFGGELSMPKSVGDADGDGLPEFQDMWTYQPDATHPWQGTGPQRQPIFWIRWPAGFRNSAAATVSDLDLDPTQPSAYQFSIADHDYFDTLKVDVPAVGPQRGYGMTPLVFSMGPDGLPGLSSGAVPMVDPYDLTSGAPVGLGWQDNIHNHLIEAR